VVIKDDTKIRVICQEHIYKNWNLRIKNHFSKINLRLEDMRKIDKKTRRIRQYSNTRYPEACTNGLYFKQKERLNGEQRSYKYQRRIKQK